MDPFLLIHADGAPAFIELQNLADHPSVLLFVELRMGKMIKEGPYIAPVYKQRLCRDLREATAASLESAHEWTDGSLERIEL